MYHDVSPLVVIFNIENSIWPCQKRKSRTIKEYERVTFILLMPSTVADHVNLYNITQNNFTVVALVSADFAQQ